MHAVADVWNSDDNLGCWYLSLTLFEMTSLLWHCGCQSSWPMNFLEFSCSPPLPFLCRSSGVTNICYHAQNFMDSRHPNSGPHTYTSVQNPPNHNHSPTRDPTCSLSSVLNAEEHGHLRIRRLEMTEPKDGSSLVFISQDVLMFS